MVAPGEPPVIVAGAIIRTIEVGTAATLDATASMTIRFSVESSGQTDPPTL